MLAPAATEIEFQLVRWLAGLFELPEALRACIVNFRTEAGDLDALLDVAAELGERIDRELRPE